MSIKAKLEAIIYAAEEPVTLEQIFVLVKETAAQEIAAERARDTVSAEANPSIADSETGLGVASNQSPDKATSAEAAAEFGAEAPSVPQGEPSEASAGEPLVEKAAEQFESGGEFSTSDGAQQPDVQSPEGQPSTETATVAATDESLVEPVVAVEGTASESTETTSTNEADENANQVTDEREALAETSAVSTSEPPTPSDQEIRAYVRDALTSLVADYASAGRGMEIRQVAGGYRMATKPEHHDLVRAFAKNLKPPIKLSLAALETLAVIAYKQPVTAPEITEIRGVDCGGVLGTLLQRKLITTAGRKAVIGRPMLYKTTKEFLLRFGLKDVNELPSIEEFERLAQEALGPDLFSDSSSSTRQEGQGSDEIQAPATDSNSEAAADLTSSTDDPSAEETEVDQTQEKETGTVEGS